MYARGSQTFRHLFSKIRFTDYALLVHSAYHVQFGFRVHRAQSGVCIVCGASFPLSLYFVRSVYIIVRSAPPAQCFLCRVWECCVQCVTCIVRSLRGVCCAQ